MKTRIILNGMFVLVNLVVINAQLCAQDVYVKTHSFFFDTDVFHELTRGQEINFTKADDTWLDGEIKHIKLIGYADCVGDKQHNQILSRKRAEMIAFQLVQLGVADSSFDIEIVAEGELPCISSNKNGDPENRRVDLVMTYALRKEEAIDVGFEEIKETGRMELVGVNFQPGLRYFLPGVETVLNAFVEALKKSPELKIELQGHICCHGKQGDGLDIETGEENLSIMRAKAVYDYLVANGIDKKRLRYKGMGNAFPKVWPEMSNADQVANRRVEAVIWE